MRVGIIGVGVVGLAWAQAIHEGECAELVLVDPHPERSPRADWARATGGKIFDDPAAFHGCDIVFVCVPGAAQPAVVDRLGGVLDESTTVVDLSTARVEDKQRAADELPGAYVDVAIMGVVPTTGVRTPLFVAGEAGDGVRELCAALEVPAHYMSGSRPGDAVRVKLLRSVIMKGLEALAVEALPAAEMLGLSDELAAALADVDQRPFIDLLRSMVATHPSQAARREVEAREAAAQLASLGLPTTVSGIVPEAYALTTRGRSESVR